MMRIARMLLALATLVAVVALTRRWGGALPALDTPDAAPDRSATILIGLLLFGSWMFGRFFNAIGLPKLSGYLIFGLVVGPGVLGVVGDDQLPYLRLVETLAIALIALMAGGEIEVGYLVRAARLVLAVAALQLVAVFAVASGVVYALAPTIGLASDSDPMVRLIAAGIAGTIATAASPAVFIAVMNEIRATGDSVRASLSVMIAKDLALVVLFTVVVAVASNTLSTGDDTVSTAHVARDLVIHLFGSIAGGVVFGLAFAWYMHAVRDHLAIFVVAGSVTIAVISDALGLEALIVALVAGVLMRNVWREQVGPVFHTMEDLSLPVYCVFFAVAGAKIDLGALASMWPAAIALVAARAAAIWITTDLGCRFARVGPPLRTWLWTAFIPQAGVSVALISIVAATFSDHAFSVPLYSLVLAVIAIHELVGPIILRLGLQRLTEAERDEDATEAPDAE